MRRNLSNFLYGIAQIFDDLGAWVKPRDEHPAFKSNTEIDQGA